MTHAILLIMLFICSCSSQQVFVKTQKPLAKIHLSEGKATKISPKTYSVQVPDGIGPVYYEVTNNEGKISKGMIPRKNIDHNKIFISTLSAALALPIMVLFGTGVTNPHLFYALETVSGPGTLWNYTFQSLSPYTLPVTFAFSLVGLSPLFAWMFSESASITNMEIKW